MSQPNGYQRPGTAAATRGVTARHAGGVVDRAITGVLELGPRSIGNWYRTPDGRKKVRYALVSLVSVPVGTAAVAAFNLAGSTAGWSAFLGSSVGAVPSYLLNRYWVWEKTEPNRVVREILPFWAITLLGISLALLVGHEAGQMTRRNLITGSTRLTILLAANVASFGLLWVAKYVLFNRFLFAVQPSDSSLEAAEGTDGG